MRIAPHLIAPACFAAAATLSALAAVWAAGAVERWSVSAVSTVLEEQGHDWAGVGADGLRVTLYGTAPTEADRFRALSLAGGVIDAGRISDAMQVAEAEALTPPDYAVEILRNDSGVTLIGLVPRATDRAALARTLARAAGEGQVADMLETADHPVPEAWDPALAFGLEILEDLPRAKVSIGAGRVAVDAIADSQQEKDRIESDLARRAPQGVRLALDISAPRPVIAPFTLRFVIDGGRPRFDACSADTEAARDTIQAAAAAAGMAGKADCTLGLGVPTPDWALAVDMAIRALGDLGAGSVTFKDADVALLVPADVAPEAFDRAVGTLESNLPDVFALSARREEPAESADGPAAPPEFVAQLTAEGQVDLSGRLADELMRKAVENFARSRFGNQAVYTAARVDPSLPKGWAVRVLAGIEALAELEVGSLTVRADRVAVSGVSGDKEARARVARILALRLGEDEAVDIAVRYDPARDPELLKPTPEECIGTVREIQAEEKITFEPGSATITSEGAPLLDQIAEVLRDCPDVPMQVQGHTDSQGREQMNLALSQARAQSVVMALLDRRVLTSNLVAKGYGEARPVADNDTEEGREANRRIEFALIRPFGPDLPSEAELARARAAKDDAMQGPAATADTAETGAPVPDVPETGAPDSTTAPAETDDGSAGTQAAQRPEEATPPAPEIQADAPEMTAPDEVAPPEQRPAPETGAPEATAPTETPVSKQAETAEDPATAPRAASAAAEASGASPEPENVPDIPVATAGEDTPRPRPVPEAIREAAAERAREIAAELAAAALAASAPEGVDLRPVTEDTIRPRPRPETGPSEGDDDP